MVLASRSRMMKQRGAAGYPISDAGLIDISPFDCAGRFVAALAAPGVVPGASARCMGDEIRFRGILVLSAALSAGRGFVRFLPWLAAVSLLGGFGGCYGGGSGVRTRDTFRV